ncbi:hypothetical protein HK098_007131 [Nowakowskiella sp. JEL0407]|nr:hypothetical protein HK098_007131 [Nowakowskiella sp. JEL0407]
MEGHFPKKKTLSTRVAQKKTSLSKYFKDAASPSPPHKSLTTKNSEVKTNKEDDDFLFPSDDDQDDSFEYDDSLDSPTTSTTTHSLPVESNTVVRESTDQNARINSIFARAIKLKKPISHVVSYPKVPADHLSKEKLAEILKQFDLDSSFGPCVGISRRERWDRAQSLGLCPPEIVKETLTKYNNDKDILISCWGTL